MGQQARNKKLFAAIEATYGSAETLTATDAVRTSGLTPVRYGGEKVEQTQDRAGLGNFRQINVNPQGGPGSFTVPYIGSGDVEVAPAWSALLQACAVAETDDTELNDEWYYTPVDNGFKSLTTIVTEEQIQQQSAGVRGNFGIEANPGQLPVFTFSNMIGSYARPVTLALTGPDDSAYLNAIPVTYSNTATVTVGGTAHPISGFTFDAGVTVERRNDPNRQETIITDRRPSGTIIMSPTQTADIIAALAAVESHNGTTDQAIVFKHGSGAGSILTLDIFAAQFGDVSDQVVAGETYFNLPFSVMPDADGDEWRLTQAAS